MKTIFSKYLKKKYRRLLPVSLFILFIICAVLLPLTLLNRQEKLNLVFEETDNPNFIYQNQHQAVQIYLGNKHNQTVPLAQFEVGKDKLVKVEGVNLKAEKTTTEKGGKLIRYVNAQPNTDITYQAIENGLKEDIIIKKAPAGDQPHDFSFIISYPKELEIKERQPNELVFYEKNGGYLFHFAKPFMVDKKNSRSENIKIKIDRIIPSSPQQPEIQYQVTYLPDPEWLSASERRYPVIVDPTIIYDKTSEFGSGDFSRIDDSGSELSPQLELAYKESPTDIHTVGLWHMNETSGSSVADSSGIGGTGTASGTAIVDGLFGKARSFNGSSDYISLPATNSLIGDNCQQLTVSAWIKSTSGSYGRIISLRRNSGSTLFSIIANLNSAGSEESGALSFMTRNAADTAHPNIAHNDNYNDNKWHHVAAVLDGLNRYLYIDGELRAQDQSGMQSVSGNTDAGLIGTFTGTSEFFGGTVDEVKISRTALTPKDIKTEAQNRPYGTYTSPVIDFGDTPQSLDSLSWIDNVTPPDPPSADYDQVKPIIIDNRQNSSTLTNYQVKVRVDYDSEMQADFDDLRFTNSSGTNLDYWIEKKINGVEANVWIEVDSITGSDLTTIYLWYGDGSASAASNGDNTFANFFADFAGLTIDTAKFDYGGGTVTQNERLAMVNGADDWDTYIYTDSTFTRTSGRTFYAEFNADSGTRSMIGWHDSGSGTSYTDLVHAIYFNNGTFNVYEDGTSRAITGHTYNVGVWYDIKIELESTGAKYYYRIMRTDNWTLLYDGSYSSESNLRPGVIHYDVTEYSYADNWYISDRSSIEPTAQIGASVELQTRTSADNSTWEEWKPTSSETTIASLDSDQSNWIWGDTSPIIPVSKSDESSIKMGGIGSPISGSMKLTFGDFQADANTVGLWHLEETSGSGAYLKDSTSYDNDLRPMGSPSVVDGFFGKAYEFNGSSQYLCRDHDGDGTCEDDGQDDDTDFDITSNLTIGYWVYMHNVGAVQPFISKYWYTDTTHNGGYSTRLQDSSGYKFRFLTMNNTSCSVFSTTIPSTYTWYHVVNVFNDSTNLVEMYVNGVRENTAACTITTANVDDSLQIGKFPNSTAYWLDGIMDEAFVMADALSNDEVAELYRSGREHHLTKTISSTDLSDDNKLTYWLAADRPGTYLQTFLGETANSVYQADANTLGLWHLEEYGGSLNMFRDSSGNGNHSTTFTGTTFTQGKIGQARYFDGSDDYIDVGADSSLNKPTNMTLSAWLKPSGYNSSYRAGIISRRNGASGLNVCLSGLSESIGPGRIEIFEGGTPPIQGKTVLALNQWYYVTVVLEGTTGTIYINGEEDLSGTVSWTWATTNVLIGNVNGYSYFFNGRMDEIQISDTARTADEIRLAYQQGLRTHDVTVDFVTNPQSTYSGDCAGSPTVCVNLTVNNPYGTDELTDTLTVGDTIIIRENEDGTEYVGQGTVTAITNTSSTYGTVEINNGSSSLSAVPPSGFTTNATVFKWQKEYWDISDISPSDRNAITKLGLKTLDGSQGATVWIDDFKSNTGYMDKSFGSTINSTPNRYLQYRTILTGNSTTPQVNRVAVNYTMNDNEKAGRPVAQWKFDEGTGTTAYDNTIGNHDGTLTNMESGDWVDGLMGKALELGGTDEWISVSNSQDVNFSDHDMAVSFFVKTTTTDKPIITKYDSSNSNGWKVELDGNGKILYTIGDGSSAPSVTSNNAVNDDDWHSVLVTRDKGDSLKIYIDGLYDNQTTDTADNIDSIVSVSIGTKHGMGVGYFVGTLDDIQLYDYALSVEQARTVDNLGFGAVLGSNKTNPSGTGPISYWKMDEGFGSTAYDEMENNNGAISGATWTNGKFGKALSFDGSDDYVNMGSSANFDITDAITISAWIKVSTSGNTFWNAIVTKGDTAYRLQLDYYHDHQTIDFSTTGLSNVDLGGDIVVKDDQWHHVVAIYGGASDPNKYIYIDGALDVSIGATGSISTNSYDVYVGRNAQYGRTLNGSIDEVKIYNYALTADEVKVEYNNSSALVLGETINVNAGGSEPVGFWKLDEGSGSYTNDSSGNGNTGVLTNGASWISNGQVGNAVSFDGTDDYILGLHNSSIDVTGDEISIFAWIYPKGDVANGTIATKAGSYYFQRHSDGKLAAYQYGTTPAGYHYSTDTVPLNQWSYVGYVYNGSRLTFYINGQPSGGVDKTGNITPLGGATEPIRIGWDTSASARYFNGYIDHVKIYDYARSTKQIAFDYSKGQPIAYWKLNEKVGATAYDDIGSYDGSYGTGSSAPSPVLGKSGWALDFDGSNDYVSANTAFGTSAPEISIGLWVKRDTAATTKGILQWSNALSSANPFVYLQDNSGTITWYVNGNYNLTGGSLNDNEWAYLSLTWDGTTWKSYKNGVYINSYTGGSTYQSGATYFYLGNGYNGFWDGKIDEVKVYNYALTAEEIKIDYSQGAVYFH